MIARLHGLLAEVSEEDAVVDVSGVGYLVRCAARTLGRLPAIGEEVLLHIETQYSDQQGARLYGFLERQERRAFVLLQSVQGVGPKAALAVLDVLAPADLAAAVAREDKALVGRAQGVGPKLAQRIVVELKDKPISDGPVMQGHGGSVAAPAPPQASVAGEAVAALMGLGVAEVLARRAVDQSILRLGDDAQVAAVIKAALQELGK